MHPTMDFYFTLCVMLVSLVLAFSAFSSSNVPESELNALYDLYNSTQGTKWQWKDIPGTAHWNFGAGANPCNQSWEGVSCDLITSATVTFRYVTKLILPRYNLNGTIPSSIGDFSKLEYLELADNTISGTVPVSISKLDQIVWLDLSYNIINSTIIEGITTLPHLAHLNFKANNFSGTLPSSLGDLSAIGFIDFSDNDLTGTLPESIGKLTALRYFSSHVNGLHGTVPDSWGNLTELLKLDLYHNYLTGTLPHTLEKCTALIDLDMSSNYFTGTIADYVGRNMSSLRSLYLAHNRLTGTIPSNLGSLDMIEYLYLNENRLRGIVPASFAKMKNLVALLLYDNDLTGNLYNVFNATLQTQLTNLLLGYNTFTGTIPAEIVQLPALSRLEMVSNCMTGQLPVALCNATALVTLALDGLHTADSCRHDLFPLTSSVYVLSDPLVGGIPECIFNLPRLTTLHLSGNGLTGSLSSDIVVSGTLSDLSLSHNILTGAIPESIQKRSWGNLDLSFNRIGGLLIADFAPQYLNTSLSLQVNRLSGAVPKSLWQAFNVSLLNGNIFHCNIEGTNLPQHDQAKKNYQCGSQLFNAAYYGWADALAGFALLLLGLILYYRRRVHSLCMAGKVAIRHCLSYLHLNEYEDECGRVGGVPLLRYKRIREATRLIVLHSLWCTTVAVVIMLPLFSILSIYYSTHAYQYAYASSIIFVSGVVPFTVIFLTMIGFWCFTIWIYWKRVQDFKNTRVRSDTVLSIRSATALVGTPSPTHSFSLDADSGSGSSPTRKNSNSSSSSSGGHPEGTGTGTGTGTSVAMVSSPTVAEVTVGATAMAAAGHGANFKVIEGTRDSMVYHNDQPLWEKSIIYVLFGVLNLVVVVAANYGFVYVYFVGTNTELLLAQMLLSVFKIGWNHLCSRVSYYLSVTGSSSRQRPKKGMLTVLLWVTIFNIIAVPCLVIAFYSRECFYGFIVAAPAVSSSVDYFECVSYNATSCTEYAHIYRTASYNPPFTYSYQCSSTFVTAYAPSYVYLGIVIAFISPFLKILGQWLLFRATPGTFWYFLLYQILPWILKPQLDSTNSHPVALEGTRWYSFVQMCFPSWIVDAASQQQRSSVKTSVEVPRPRFSPYFDARRLLIVNFNFLGVLMTFGVVFPPLAAVMALAIASSVAFSRWETKNFIKDAVENNRSAYIRAIDDDCRGVGTPSMMLRSAWILTTLSCWFYTLFLFDILGDKMGFYDTYWVLIVVPIILPMCLFIVYRMYMNRRNLKRFFSVDRNSTFMSRSNSSSSGSRERLFSLRDNPANPDSDDDDDDDGDANYADEGGEKQVRIEMQLMGIRSQPVVLPAAAAAAAKTTTAAATATTTLSGSKKITAAGSNGSDGSVAAEGSKDEEVGRVEEEVRNPLASTASNF